jgi:hypothetical protein
LALNACSARVSAFMGRRSPVRSWRIVVLAVSVAAVLMPTVVTRNAEAATSYFLDIWPEMDTYVSEQMPDTTYGISMTLEAGYYRIGEMELYHSCILLKFDLSLLPSDTVLVDAYLYLYLTDGGGRTLELMRLDEAWDHRYASWNNQPAPAYPLPSENLTWVVTATPSQQGRAITSMVQGWMDESYPNNGLTVRPYEWNTEGLTDPCTFYSQEGASVEPDEDIKVLKMPKLRVQYISSEPVPQPDPPDPPPWIDDTVPPAIAMMITPAEPIRPTDTVTVTVLATDDKCLDSVLLYVDWVAVANVLVPYSDLDNVSIEVEYSATMSLGAHHIQVMVTDRMSHLVGEYERIWVGSNTPPAVSVNCTPSVMLPEDNSVIEVTVRATDEEGIKSVVVGLERGIYDPVLYPDHSESVTFAPPYPTSYEWTVTFRNKLVPNMMLDRLNASSVLCGARVMDAEMLSATATEPIELVRPYQWDYGIPYENPGADNLGWQRMEDAFGHGELWGPGSLEWWHTAVARFWKPIYSMMARNGECFGMSMYSLWHYYNDIPVPDSLTEHVGDELPPPLPGYEEFRYAKRTIEMYQGAQISQELLSRYIGQVWDELRASRAISPFLAGPFQRMLEDLEDGKPGILYTAEYRGLDEGLTEMVGAHAVVPYFAREVSDGVWHVYVYDSNRYEASTTYFSDVDNFEHYPYVVISEDGFEWHQLVDRDAVPRETEFWNDFIWYVSYEDAVRDDYDLMDGWLVAATIIITIVVAVTVLAIAAPVLITVQGLLPIPLPLPMGETAPMQSIAIPAGEDFALNFTGQEESEYNWVLASGYSNYGIQNRSCGDGSVDVLMMEMGEDRLDYGLRFKGDLPDDDYMMGMMHRVGEEYREYSLLNVSTSGNSDFATHATADGDSFVLANRGDAAVTASVLLRSSREVGEARQEITVDPGEKVTITANWDDLTEPLEVTSESIDGADDVIYYVVIVSSVIIILAVVLTAILRRRRGGGKV